MRTHVDTVTTITNVNYLYKHRTFILIIFVVSTSFTAIKKGADILQQYKKPRPKRTVSCMKHRVMHTTANKKAKFGVLSSRERVVSSYKLHPSYLRKSYY